MAELADSKLGVQDAAQHGALRFVADTLSGANLVCGLASMVFAAHGRLELSLLALLVGAVFDGLDGAAARRWGGTRFGVYSDDIADGVNYGLAPGVAIYFALGGSAGLIMGLAYSLFTISRLVYFTLAKSAADPGVFAGVPSTVGGLIVLCALICFPHQEALVGLMVGVACAQMVSFASHYPHLGRRLGEAARARSPMLLGAPISIALLLVGAQLWGPAVPAALLLATTLAYGFTPALLAFAQVLPERQRAG